jgi:hypothetical protein
MEPAIDSVILSLSRTPRAQYPIDSAALAIFLGRFGTAGKGIPRQDKRHVGFDLVTVKDDFALAVRDLNPRQYTLWRATDALGRQR